MHVSLVIYLFIYLLINVFILDNKGFLLQLLGILMLVGPEHRIFGSRTHLYIFLLNRKTNKKKRRRNEGG